MATGLAYWSQPVYNESPLEVNQGFAKGPTTPPVGPFAYSGRNSYFAPRPCSGGTAVRDLTPLHPFTWVNALMAPRCQSYTRFQRLRSNAIRKRRDAPRPCVVRFDEDKRRPPRRGNPRGRTRRHLRASSHGVAVLSRGPVTPLRASQSRTPGETDGARRRGQVRLLA